MVFLQIPFLYYFFIFKICNFIIPAGASTSTISFFFLPIKAFPIGDSLEILFADKSTSVVPTIVWWSLNISCGKYAQNNYCN